jgi:hypothetical protein
MTTAYEKATERSIQRTKEDNPMGTETSGTETSGTETSYEAKEQGFEARMDEVKKAAAEAKAKKDAAIKAMSPEEQKVALAKQKAESEEKKAEVAAMFSAKK